MSEEPTPSAYGEPGKPVPPGEQTPPEAGPPGEQAAPEAGSPGEQAAPEAGPRRVRVLAAVRRRPLVTGFTAGILAAAVIAAVVLVTVRSTAQQLRYTGLPAPCDMLTSATVSRYLPGATSNPVSTSSTSAVQMGACSWMSIGTGQDRNLVVAVSVYGSYAKAQQMYDDAVSHAVSGKGFTISKQTVTDVGDQATAVTVSSTAKPAAQPQGGTAAQRQGGTAAQPQSSTAAQPQGGTAAQRQGGTAAQPAGNAVPPSVTLLVRSGNADISLTSVVFPAGSAPRLTIAAQLAGMTAMARDVLAALAHPSAVHPETGRPMSPAAPSPSPSAPRPRYAGPKDTCALVKPATLARYGATSAGTPAPGPTASLPPGGPVSGNCGWHLPAGIIFLDVSVYPDSVSAQQAYEFEVQDTHQSGHGVTFDGAQPVKGVGQRATAIAQTIAGASHELTLYAWSDNAVIEVSFADLGTPLAGPPTPRSVRLAGDTAIARDVLARLPS